MGIPTSTCNILFSQPKVTHIKIYKSTISAYAWYSNTSQDIKEILGYELVLPFYTNSTFHTWRLNCRDIIIEPTGSSQLPSRQSVFHTVNRSCFTNS